jgi:hypothetical protein
VSDIVADIHDFDLGAFASPEEALAALAGLADDAADEIERLRGLLRECCAALGWQGHNEQCLDPAYNDYDPACPECLLLKRVREALGE